MNFYDTNDYYDYGSPYMETTLIGIMMIFVIIMLVCARSEERRVGKEC